jgi:cob(I)alamin adenosyltransferase
VSLNHSEPVGDAILVYLNRLSDLFFAMARRANKERGVADTPWIPGA